MARLRVVRDRCRSPPINTPPPPIASPHDKILELDGWRGLAIATVLIGHFLPLPFFNAGRLGVELFFVLSGRLMADILFVRREPLGKFYWRRFSRVYPTLLVFILACVLLIPTGWTLHPPAGSGLAAATLTINYVHVLGYGAQVFDHIWSLCIEEHCYLLLGLLTLTAARWQPRIHVLIIGIAVAFMLNGARLTWVDGQDYYQAFWRTDVRGAGILLGCAFQVWRSRRPEIADAVDGKRVLLALIFAWLLSLYPVPDPVKYSAATALFAFALVFIDKAPAALLALFRSAPLRYLGLTSYSLYLWQQPFFAAKDLLPKGVALAGALAVGLASYYLIEGPSRRTLNALARRVRGARTASAG